MSTEELNASYWKEKVYIETAEYIIRGYIFMPATGKRERMLSEALNSKKDFIAIKDCTLEHKKFNSRKELEPLEFIQVNVSTILILKPLS